MTRSGGAPEPTARRMTMSAIGTPSATEKLHAATAHHEAGHAAMAIEMERSFARIVIEPRAVLGQRHGRVDTVRPRPLLRQVSIKKWGGLTIPNPRANAPRRRTREEDEADL